MSRYHPRPLRRRPARGRLLAGAARHRARPTIPSQHKKLGEYGILDSLKLPQPPPPLRFPRHPNGFTVQVFWDSDVGKWIEAASYALSHRRDADIEAKIEAIVDDFEKAQAARRLPQLLVSRPRAREALDQPARQPRALQCRPHARRRHRLFRDHRTAALARHHGALSRPHPRTLRHRPGPEARLLRAPGNRAGADQALPPDRRQEAPRPRRPTSSTSAASSRRTISTSRRRARGDGLPSSATSTATTNTASRTSRCASRTRWSATRCAPCTSTPPWPTSPPRLDDAALEAAPARCCGTT